MRPPCAPNQLLIFLNYDTPNWILLFLHRFSHKLYGEFSSAKPKHYKDTGYGLLSSFTELSCNKHKASLGKVLARKKCRKIITFKAIFSNNNNNNNKIHTSLDGSGVQWCQQWPMGCWQDKAICWDFKGSSQKQYIYFLNTETFRLGGISNLKKLKNIFLKISKMMLSNMQIWELLTIFQHKWQSSDSSHHANTAPHPIRCKQNPFARVLARNGKAIAWHCQCRARWHC